ncbi:MAG: patatin-like phospholipase family protein, partial [Zoogloea sp.]|nr:patatin-like phospholipase family protein [Zoogloea sp.]
MAEGRAALVLTGGGARAAYQVGALIAVRDVWGKRPENPFPIICGTSAGAVNAVALAVFSADFNEAVRKLAFIWRNFHVDHVYRADTLA